MVNLGAGTGVTSTIGATNSLTAVNFNARGNVTLKILPRRLQISVSVIVLT